MIISSGRNNVKMNDFKIYINQNFIDLKDNVKNLGVHFDNKLTWKIHINNLCKKLFKVCGMIYKLRYFVPLSTLKN